MPLIRPLPGIDLTHQPQNPKPPEPRRSKMASEQDLAATVMKVLEDEGWDCYPEVSFGKLLSQADSKAISSSHFGTAICDIVAIKRELVMVIECKRTYSLDLLEQAIEWTRLAPLVAVAIPAANVANRKGLREHMRDYFGIGLYGVTHGALLCREPPRLLRHNRRNVPIIRRLLTPSMKISTPGAQRTWRRTPYQDTMSEVRCALELFGPMALSALYAYLVDDAEQPRHHYSSDTSMKSCVGASVRGEIEPDLVLEEDGKVHWHIDQCTKGAKYIEHIQDWAMRRRRLTATAADRLL